jgi:hypothetical protein
MSIVYWCLHIWGDSIQAACSGNGQANFDKEFETMIDNGRETLQADRRRLGSANNQLTE